MHHHFTPITYQLVNYQQSLAEVKAERYVFGSDSGNPDQASTKYKVLPETFDSGRDGRKALDKIITHCSPG